MVYAEGPPKLASSTTPPTHTVYKSKGYRQSNLLAQRKKNRQAIPYRTKEKTKSSKSFGIHPKIPEK
eukprot:2612858-Amphidinium_carterae.1